METSVVKRLVVAHVRFMQEVLREEYQQALSNHEEAKGKRRRTYPDPGEYKEWLKDGHDVLNQTDSSTIERRSGLSRATFLQICNDVASEEEGSYEELGVRLKVSLGTAGSVKSLPRVRICTTESV